MTSLRLRIILSTLIIVFLIISGSYLVIQNIQTGIIEGEFRDKGFLLANGLASEISASVLTKDLTKIRISIENVKDSYPDIEYIVVTDSEGKVLVHTFDDGFPEALKNMTRPSNVREEHVSDIGKGIVHEFDALIFRNTGYVHVGLSENRVREQIGEASKKLLLLAISAMFFGGVFTYFIGRWLTDPISKLTEGAKRINKGILDQKIVMDSGDELGELARTFNDMALNLDQKIKDLVVSGEQRENAQKYLETLIDSIEDGIIVVNIDHEIIKMNRSFLKITGLTEEQILGRSCHEMIFKSKPSQSQKEECPINTLLHTKNPVRYLHEIESSEGKKILEINASQFLDKKGIANIILVLRDVTQQKQLEEEIIVRNRELIVLNEISRNISKTFDLNKILLSALENLLSLTMMESGGVYLFDEKSGDFSLKIHLGKDEDMNDLEPVIKGDKIMITGDLKKRPDLKTSTDEKDSIAHSFQIPLKSKDKVLGIITIRSREPHKFSVKDMELFHAIGNQVGIAIENIAFYNNIKYLKEFNEEILNNVNLAIHVIDRDMKILAINHELIKLGRGKFKKEDVINKNIFEVFPFLKEKFVDKEYEHVIKTGEVFLSEEKTEYYDEVIYTSTSKIPIKDENGNVEKIITVIKDISFEKKLEEELKDSYEELKLTYLKLKELYQIKDNFLSNMSYELRTPLTSIIGYTELMLEEELTPEQRHKLEIVLRSSRRLSKLIHGLLDTELIESNNFQLVNQMLSVYEIAVQVAEDMRDTASIKNIPIYVEVPQSLMVEGDRDRLMQVFSNLMDNAVKFTISGEIRIEAEEEDDCAHIRIIDTGVGIPEDKLESIFNRFYQLDSTKARKYKGIGLGLWISKKIVEAHGGKIWTESKNRGSTFHILLPKQRKKTNT